MYLQLVKEEAVVDELKAKRSFPVHVRQRAPAKDDLRCRTPRAPKERDSTQERERRKG